MDGWMKSRSFTTLLFHGSVPLSQVESESSGSPQPDTSADRFHLGTTSAPVSRNHSLSNHWIVEVLKRSACVLQNSKLYPKVESLPAPHRTVSAAEKQKVYQGVRVKITVKELLQQRRALQAGVTTTTALTTANSPQLAEPVYSSHAAPHNVCPPSNGRESSFYECNQFPENVPYDQNPIFYESTEVYERCLPDLYTDNSLTPQLPTLHCPPASYQTPTYCNHSAMISGSPAYSSVDYGYSTQCVPTTPEDFSPSSHLDPNSFYSTPEEYFSHQHYSCTSAICSIFSYMPDNIEMGLVSENGSFTMPEYNDYSPAMLTEDIWRGNLNECLDY
ncbi:colorectal cancer associated 2 [Heterodontus francisci]|uniref:colorectal cancer associated 2 n=1 Tax=Heterodontus francisci TaxID=7792 RepID=UPI00355C63DB